jgi:hypothetical protein
MANPFWALPSTVSGHGTVDRSSPITEADSFPEQWEYITASDRFNIQWSGRRAAKTSGSRMRTAMRNEAQPGRRVLYIHQTFTNAEQQFFRPLVDVDPPEADQKKYGFRALSLKARHVQHRVDNTDLMVWWANGSFLRCMGCNNLAEVKKKLGEFWHEIIIDEMQSYADDVLYELIDRAILPTMIDRSGSALFQGTPPVTKAGFWYNLISKSAFRKYHWTLFQNPYIDHDAENVYAARGIKTTDPIYRREVLGEICVDPNAMVFLYESPRNDIGEEGKPDTRSPHFRCTMGVDLGFSDNDAIVVLGWMANDKAKRLYEMWSWQGNELDYLKLADKFKAAVERWRPVEICVDTGGHGARKIMESLRALFSVYKFRMKPGSVADSIALMNDDFRTGRFLVDPNGLIAHDASLVVWKPDQHGVEISETFHSDIMAAARYAHSCSYHYLAEPTEEEIQAEESDEDRRVREWLRRREIEQDPANPYRD